MQEIIKQGSYEISIDKVTGEVLIQTIDYHPQPRAITIDFDLALKILGATHKREQYLRDHPPGTGK